jgi:hypothetical protein
VSDTVVPVARVLVQRLSSFGASLASRASAWLRAAALSLRNLQMVERSSWGGEINQFHFDSLPFAHYWIAGLQLRNHSAPPAAHATTAPDSRLVFLPFAASLRGTWLWHVQVFRHAGLAKSLPQGWDVSSVFTANILRNMKKTLLVLFALLLCLPITLVGESSTDDPCCDVGRNGNKYLGFCVKYASKAEETGAINPIVCHHWMTGVIEGILASEAASHKTLFELPAGGISTEQIEKIAVKYMNDHPQILHKPTSALVLWSLMDAYPPRK